MLTGIFGALGSGKTLLLVYLAHIQKYTHKKIVIANFQLSFADIIESAEEMILKMDDYEKQFKGKNICFVIDELGGILKATDFMQSYNEIMTDICLKSRKRRIDIIYTAQHHMMVDRMVRRITDVIFKPIFNQEKQTIKINPKEFDGEFWLEGESFSFNPPDYYNFYDTDEVIYPNKEAVVQWYSEKAKKKEKMLIQLANESKIPERRKIVKWHLEVGGELAEAIIRELVTSGIL